MYKTLLEQVHAGDYQPANQVDRGERYKEYHEVSAVAVDLYEEFRKELPVEQQEKLDKVLDAQVEVTNVANKDNYIEGAKFGARLILELLGDELLV